MLTTEQAIATETAHDIDETHLAGFTTIRDLVQWAQEQNFYGEENAAGETIDETWLRDWKNQRGLRYEEITGDDLRELYNEIEGA